MVDSKSHVSGPAIVRRAAFEPPCAIASPASPGHASFVAPAHSTAPITSPATALATNALRFANDVRRSPTPDEVRGWLVGQWTGDLRRSMRPVLAALPDAAVTGLYLLRRQGIDPWLLAKFLTEQGGVSSSHVEILQRIPVLAEYGIHGIERAFTVAPGDRDQKVFDEAPRLASLLSEWDAALWQAIGTDAIRVESMSHLAIDWRQLPEPTARWLRQYVYPDLAPALRETYHLQRSVEVDILVTQSDRQCRLVEVKSSRSGWFVVATPEDRAQLQLQAIRHAMLVRQHGLAGVELLFMADAVDPDVVTALQAAYEASGVPYLIGTPHAVLASKDLDYTIRPDVVLPRQRMAPLPSIPVRAVSEPTPSDLAPIAAEENPGLSEDVYEILQTLLPPKIWRIIKKEVANELPSAALVRMVASAGVLQSDLGKACREMQAAALEQLTCWVDDGSLLAVEYQSWRDQVLAKRSVQQVLEQVIAIAEARVPSESEDSPVSVRPAATTSGVAWEAHDVAAVRQAAVLAAKAITDITRDISEGLTDVHRLGDIAALQALLAETVDQSCVTVTVQGVIWHWEALLTDLANAPHLVAQLGAPLGEMRAVFTVLHALEATLEARRSAAQREVLPVPRSTLRQLYAALLTLGAMRAARGGVRTASAPAAHSARTYTEADVAAMVRDGVTALVLYAEAGSDARYYYEPELHAKHVRWRHTLGNTWTRWAPYVEQQVAVQLAALTKAGHSVAALSQLVGPNFTLAHDVETVNRFTHAPINVRLVAVALWREHHATQDLSDCIRVVVNPDGNRVYLVSWDALVRRFGALVNLCDLAPEQCGASLAHATYAPEILAALWRASHADHVLPEHVVVGGVVVRHLRYAQIHDLRVGSTEEAAAWIGGFRIHVRTQSPVDGTSLLSIGGHESWPVAKAMLTAHGVAIPADPIAERILRIALGGEIRLKGKKRQFVSPNAFAAWLREPAHLDATAALLVTLGRLPPASVSADGDTPVPQFAVTAFAKSPGELTGVAIRTPAEAEQLSPVYAKLFFAAGVDRGWRLVTSCGKGHHQFAEAHWSGHGIVVPPDAISRRIIYKTMGGQIEQDETRQPLTVDQLAAWLIRPDNLTGVLRVLGAAGRCEDDKPIGLTVLCASGLVNSLMVCAPNAATESKSYITLYFGPATPGGRSLISMSGQSWLLRKKMLALQGIDLSHHITERLICPAFGGKFHPERSTPALTEEAFIAWLSNPLSLQHVLRALLLSEKIPPTGTIALTVGHDMSGFSLRTPAAAEELRNRSYAKLFFTYTKDGSARLSDYNRVNSRAAQYAQVRLASEG